VSPRAKVPTRDRIVYASAELLRRQGYAGTGLKQIASEAQAPFGSLYHFFPGGKEQLAEEVLRTGGRFFLALYEAFAAAAPDLPTAVRDFFAGAAQTLENTDFADACPIATVAGEVASTNEVLRQATADVFESWLAAVTEDATRAGIERFLRDFTGAGIQGEVRTLWIGGPPWALTLVVRFDDRADGPGGEELYANRVVIVARTRWGRIVDHDDFYVDTQRIVAFEEKLRALGVAAAG